MIKNNFFGEYFIKYSKLVDGLDHKKIDYLYNKINKLKKDNKVMIFGNGAGASIASHVASDLTNAAKVKSLSFDNTAQLSCYANDYKFENWVKKTIESYSFKNDLVILLSASGNSKNMLNAARYCIKNKINYFSITGFKKNNKLNKISKNFYWIDSNSYNYVESIQLLILLSIVDKISNTKN
tara:strand:- start:990 stop:1535 length:546 start_codon:yes stop_codon:yes gene_type:complete